MPYLDEDEQRACQKKYYENNKIKYRDSVRKRRAIKKLWYKAVLDTLSCLVCGESSNECLDFHHIDPNQKDPNQKDASVSFLLGSLRTEQRVTAEMAKCVVLCSNCHRKYHAGTLGREFTSDDCVNISPTLH